MQSTVKQQQQQQQIVTHYLILNFLTLTPFVVFPSFLLHQPKTYTVYLSLFIIIFLMETTTRSWIKQIEKGAIRNNARMMIKWCMYTSMYNQMSSIYTFRMSSYFLLCQFLVFRSFMILGKWLTCTAYQISQMKTFP